MTKDITVYLKDGTTLRFTNVEPLPKTKVAEKNEQELLESVTEDKQIKKDDLSDYIHNDYFIKLFYTSASSKDKNFAVFLKDQIAGISITNKRFVKPVKEKEDKEQT